jgi:flagellar hook-associated protein 3 FlgL
MTEIATTGDLARQLILRRQNADTRAQMDALVGEVATGRKADLPGLLRGDFAALASIERDLALLESYRVSASELSSRADASALALETIRTATEAMAPKLLGAEAFERLGTVEVLASEARQSLGSVLDTLDTRFGGRALFAGAATGTAAVIDGEAMLAELRAATAGATTADEVETAVRDWFAPGAGYDTVGYLGASDPVAPQPVGRTRALGVEVTAADPRLREMLIGFSMAALSDGAPLAGDLDAQGDLAARAGRALASAATPLTDISAEIGAMQSELDLVETSNAAERTALETARGDLIDADIFDSAGRLEAIQGQLDILYAITARTSRLSLANYL